VAAPSARISLPEIDAHTALQWGLVDEVEA